MKFLQWITSNAWAVEGGYLARALPVLQRRVIDGEKLDPEQILAIVAARDARRGGRGIAALDNADTPPPEPGSTYIRSGSVAILPIGGVIAKHMSQVNRSSQPAGTSLEALTQGTLAAFQDPKVKSVLGVIESPGGMVSGMPEYASLLRTLRMQKPLVMYADDMAASAGYWIAAQGQRVIASSMAQTGSIGVYQVIWDDSAKVEKSGVKVHVLRAGVNKGLNVEGAPVPERYLASEQAHVNEWYGRFVRDVAIGRGMDPAKVLDQATGDVWFPKDAMARGLIDGTGDLADVVAEMDRQYGTARVLAPV